MDGGGGIGRGGGGASVEEGREGCRVDERRGLHGGRRGSMREEEGGATQAMGCRWCRRRHGSRVRWICRGRWRCAEGMRGGGGR
jgi:hypothetical protein